MPAALRRGEREVVPGLVGERGLELGPGGRGGGVEAEQGGVGVGEVEGLGVEGEFGFEGR